MKKDKIRFDEDNTRFKRGDNTESSTLNQQINEYEAVIKQSADHKEKVHEEIPREVDSESTSEEEEKEIVKLTKKHKVRLAAIGVMILVFVTGSMLYQYVKARGVLELPIYYLNNKEITMIYENTGAAKELQDFNLTSEELFSMSTFNDVVHYKAQISRNGEYSLYPDNPWGGDPYGCNFDLMVREIGNNKAKLLAEQIFEYEEVAENYIVTYSRNNNIYTADVYNLKTNSRIRVGTEECSVFQLTINVEAGMMIWLQADQDDRISLYYQKMDQSEDAVCVVNQAESCWYMTNEELSYIYYTYEKQIYMIENFGTPKVIADDMYISGAIDIGKNGEVYLVKGKKLQPFDYIEMDTPLSSEIMSDINNYDYGEFSNELYYFVPNNGLSLVTNQYGSTISRLTGVFRVESPMLVYEMNTLEQRGKLLASSITKATDLFNWMYDEEYGDAKLEVCYEGRVVLSDKSITSMWTNPEEETIYYVEKNADGSLIDSTINEQLKMIQIDSNNQEEMIVDSVIGKIIGFAEGQPYYGVDKGVALGELTNILYDNRIVLKDVLFSSVYYNQKRQVFGGIREYSKVLGNGTLVEVDQEGNETVIMEEVSAYAMIDDERMLIITKNLYKEETMYLYYQGKMRIVDEGKFKVLSRVEAYWDAEKLDSNHLN